MSEPVRDALRQFIDQELMIGEETPIADDDELLADGIIDSLGVIRLVGFIESEFGVLIPPEEVVVETFRTVNVLADHINARSGGSLG